MKKFIISAIFVGLSGLYVFYRPQIAITTSTTTVSGADTVAPNGSITAPVINVRRHDGDDDDDEVRVIRPNTTPAPPAPTPVPATPPSQTPATSIYKDGVYTGSVADAYYGLVQVKATITNGKITDVVFLSYPNAQNTSRQINTQAMPYLKQEAIQAQTSNVNIISGATETSLAFKQSLSFALASARK